MTLPLCTGEASPGVMGLVPGSPVQERLGQTGESPTKMMNRLGHLSYKENNLPVITVFHFSLQSYFMCSLVGTFDPLALVLF